MMVLTDQENNLQRSDWAPSEKEKVGVDIIRDWFRKNVYSKKEKSGIEIVRDFMDVERGEDQSWPLHENDSATAPQWGSSEEDDGHARRRRNGGRHWRRRAVERGSIDAGYQRDDESYMSHCTPTTEYQHEQGGAHQQATPCKFFFSPSGCMYGADCRFSHEASPIAQPNFAAPFPGNSYPMPVGVPICPFFAQGHCRFGMNCAYAHPGEYEHEHGEEWTEEWQGEQNYQEDREEGDTRSGQSHTEDDPDHDHQHEDEDEDEHSRASHRSSSSLSSSSEGLLGSNSGSEACAPSSSDIDGESEDASSA